MSGVAGKRPADLSAPTGHCGVLELRADKIRVYDYLGLFSRHVPSPPPARMQCSPIPADTPPPLLPEGLGLPASYGAVRRGPGEDYDLRDYRPGDSLRMIHWKMTAKRDELVTREPPEDTRPLPVLTFDNCGPLAPCPSPCSPWTAWAPLGSWTGCWTSCWGSAAPC